MEVVGVVANVGFDGCVAGWGVCVVWDDDGAADYGAHGGGAEEYRGEGVDNGLAEGVSGDGGVCEGEGYSTGC